MTTRERALDRRDYKRRYYRKHKAKWHARSKAEAARRKADPEARKAFNAKQREYYAKRKGVTDPVLPAEETEALKKAWRARY